MAYRSGTFTGMLTDGLGLLGGTVIFMIFGKAAPDALLGFGLGGTLVALFMRIGGGIYTKSADVGADLVGKVEQGLPEDDPRNAAVMADLVGDNVGDCAGMAADIFESYEVTIVSTLILGLFLLHLTGDTFWIVYPLIVRAIGVISSILGTFTVPIWENFPLSSCGRMTPKERCSVPTKSRRSIPSSSPSFSPWPTPGSGSWLRLNAVGVGLAVVFNPLTSYVHLHPQPGCAARSPSRPRPVRPRPSCPACPWVWKPACGACMAIVVALSISFLIFTDQPLIYMLYGVAMIGIGMLSHTGNNVAMDAFGPISDNANGIGEMAHVGPKAYALLAELDAVGNTTKAITKQIAIASAVVAATALFFSFIAECHAPDASERSGD